MKEDWKNRFASHILLRGYQYYTEGKVWDLQREGNRFTAVVAGTEDYDVAISFDEEGAAVTGMSCSCPYAEDGDHCSKTRYSKGSKGNAAS